MMQPPGAASGYGLGVPSALAFAVAGVLPEGEAAPRLGHRRAGEGYEQARRVTGEVVAVDQGLTLRFALPAVPVDFILIEPAAVPGRYCIPRMVYAGREVDDLGRRVIAAHARLDEAPAGGGIRFMSMEGRPAVELDVRGLAGDTSGRHVDLVLCRDADGVVAADALAQGHASIARERDATRADFARVTRTLATVSARIEGISAAIGTPVDGAAGPNLAERVEAFAAADAARDVRIAAMELQLAPLVDALARSEQSLAALVPVIERATAVRAASDTAAAADRETTASDYEGLRQLLLALQGQVERVTHSVENVFWRRWLRRLRGGGQ